jgi:hypothetical protein
MRTVPAKEAVGLRSRRRRPSAGFPRSLSPFDAADEHFVARGITSRNQRQRRYLDSTWAEATHGCASHPPPRRRHLVLATEKSRRGASRGGKPQSKVARQRVSKRCRAGHHPHLPALHCVGPGAGVGSKPPAEPIAKIQAISGLLLPDLLIAQFDSPAQCSTAHRL